MLSSCTENEMKWWPYGMQCNAWHTIGVHYYDGIVILKCPFVEVFNSYNSLNSASFYGARPSYYSASSLGDLYRQFSGPLHMYM